MNHAALARAFDSLSGQHVSLDKCRIDVAGSKASAHCDGSSSWTPKIGDRTRRTEARRWEFELVRGADGWRILNAAVQNR